MVCGGEDGTGVVFTPGALPSSLGNYHSTMLFIHTHVIPRMDRGYNGHDPTGINTRHVQKKTELLV
jgi:hypothetical protein